MLMNLFARTGAALFLALLSCSAIADIVIDIIGGEEAAIPIAVVPFSWQGAGEAPIDMAAIISSNLQRSGQFNTLPRTELAELPGFGAQVDLGRWRAKGVRFLVTGRIEPGSEGTHRVSFDLLDILSGQSEFGQSYRGVTRDQLRYAAHLVSNDIHRHLLGQRGVFDSSIAYIAIDEENGQRRWRLMYADADGANPIALMSEQRPLMSPAFSADGRKIAYVSFATRRPEIFIRDVFDVGSRRVAGVEGLNSAPAWSPDGRQLAVAQSREGAVNIYLIDVASGNRRQLTDHWGIDTEPTWTPDGRHILFTSDRAGSPQVYRIAVDGGRVERITFEGSYNASPALSPDGTLLAVVHRSAQGYVIATQSLRGGQFRILTRTGNEERPTFSPNGSMILYATQDARGRRVIETVSVYGSRRQGVPSRGDIAREPAWAPLPSASRN